MRQLVFLPVFLALVVVACGGSNIPSRERTLTVYAAVSLTDAFNEIGKAFAEKHPGVVIAFNFGGSQNLRTQIEQGAPNVVSNEDNIRQAVTKVKLGEYLGLERSLSIALALSTVLVFVSLLLLLVTRRLEDHKDRSTR